MCLQKKKILVPNWNFFFIKSKYFFLKLTLREVFKLEGIGFLKIRFGPKQIEGIIFSYLNCKLNPKHCSDWVVNQIFNSF